jgi:OCT family organic cation transporter-like MFS transporter 15
MANTNAHTFKSIDDILSLLNPYGRFQRLVNVILAIMFIPASFHYLIMYFVAVDPSWRCVANSTVCLLNGTHSSYNMHKCNLPRKQWEYTEEIGFSIITQFDLYCENIWMVHLANSIYFVGTAVGSFILGWLSNVHGRKIVIFSSAVTIIIVGFLSAFVPNMPLFIACRFIIGFSTPGNAYVAHILIGELVDNEHRPLASMIILSTYTMAILLLGLKAYFIRRWRSLLIACTMPYLFVIIFYNYVPESVRWLYLHNLNEKLIKIFKRMAYWNKTTIPDNFVILPPNLECTEKKRWSHLQLLRTRTIAIRSVTLAYCWFASYVVYFGLFLSAGDLGGSLYVNFIVFSAIEIPANIILGYLSEHIGRRAVTATSMTIGSLTCVFIAFIPSNEKLVILRIVLGTIGQGCLVMAYNGIIPWTIEILPTDIRSVGVGMFAAAGHCGGMASSWIAKALKSKSVLASFVVIGIIGFSAGCLLFSFPETKGLVMKDVDDEDTMLLRSIEDDKRMAADTE